ncbi:MAG: undecaprenyl-diphosphate phosphatase [Myxococcales bacterium]|nr:MAG: undecaprenyl-diphosphate phosphatase [Myxococcales bacterium]
MNVGDALILGIVQGLTEFLPVSSSGHLVLGHHLLGMQEPDVFFDVVLHVGTLAAVFLFYRRELLGLCRAALSFLGRPLPDPAHPLAAERRLLLYIFVATAPTGLIGVLFKDTFEAAFGSLVAVGAMLWTTAALLVTTRFTFRRAGTLTWRRALALGVVQGLAILPGLSRSGSTISAAMLGGVSAEEAMRFSFLMSIPAILGAVTLKAADADFAALSPAPFAVGLFVSAVVGYLALVVLARAVKSGRLYLFSFWCGAAGALALYLALVG